MAETQNDTQSTSDENKDFYANAEKYWSSIDATDNGVLGGFGWISDVDIRGSNKFLNAILKGKNAPNTSRALDCGAGIGRVTRELLLSHFDKVDLVEQNATFLEEAKKRLDGKQQLGVLYPCSLRTFEHKFTYDVIWCQWVLGHLVNDDLVAFLRRCSAALRPQGVIVIKENISKDGLIEDSEDSSVTRTATQYIEIFRNAKLRIVRQAVQTNFPAGLFSVKIFALRPQEDSKTQVISNGTGSVPSN